jgi:hypothetical protein
MPVELNYPKIHPWLLGYNLVKDKEEVVLTSSAADMLTVMQHLSVPVLCTPLGNFKFFSLKSKHVQPMCQSAARWPYDVLSN